jgi:hypothetical protein
MLQAINSKRKSEGNDCTANISDQTFKKFNDIYFKWEIRILQGAKEQGNQWGLFHRASGIINTRLVKMTYLNVTDVKNNKWKP